MSRVMKANKRTEPKYNAAATEEEPILGKPTPEEIAERAYENFEAEGSQHGNHLEHWLSAEERLIAESTF